ncbi:hypothetical protein PYCC9005_004456 [Savitreella phatthalungensis]
MTARGSQTSSLPALWPPFELQSHDATSSLLVTPLKHVLRSLISPDALGNARFFSSDNDGLARTLDGRSALVAHVQDAGDSTSTATSSRSKRLVVIEILSPDVYAYLPVVSKLPYREFPDYQRPVQSDAGDEPQIDFTADDWWQACECDWTDDDADADAAFSGSQVELDFGDGWDEETAEEVETQIPRPASTAPSVSSRPAPVDSAGPIPGYTQSPSSPPLLPAVDLDHAPSRPLEAVLADLSKLYVTTLYTSRAPLAFIAKSTLPKLRAQIPSDDLPALSQHILTNIVPTLPRFDAKYKSFLPTFVKAELTGLPIEHDLSCLKDGTDELTYIKSWLELVSEDATTATNLTPDALLSRHLQPLKVREAQLTVIFLLEALCCPADSSLPEGVLAPEVMLDLMIDRLSIWQTIDFSSTDDKLRAFCLDALLPFYGHRLPDILADIQVKCGAAADAYLIQDMPKTPLRIRDKERSRDKDKAKGKSRAKLSSSSTGGKSTLKRTESAPAGLLSAKKVVPQKRSLDQTLNRQVSMSKRMPTSEVSVGSSRANQGKHAGTKIANLSDAHEEKRRRRMELLDKERVQVGVTPSKAKPTFTQVDPVQQHAISQFAPAYASKASFMFGECEGEQDSDQNPASGPYVTGISATPQKRQPGSIAVAETPQAPALMLTPQRAPDSRVVAAAPGVEDTPSRSVLFHLASPTLGPSRSVSVAKLRPPSISLGPIMPSTPLLRKSHTVPAARSSSSASLRNPFDEDDVTPLAELPESQLFMQVSTPAAGHKPTTILMQTPVGKAKDPSDPDADRDIGHAPQEPAVGDLKSMLDWL